LVIGDGEIGAQKRGNGCVRRNSLVSSRNSLLFRLWIPGCELGVPRCGRWFGC